MSSQQELVPAAFEAAFEHERVLVRADVIERLPGGGWRLVEVKSTTRLKEIFILDVAVQLWVLHGAGLDVREAAVLTLDRDYVYDGARLDIDSLFRLHPVFDEASALLDSVDAGVHEDVVDARRAHRTGHRAGRTLFHSVPVSVLRTLLPRPRLS